MKLTLNETCLIDSLLLVFGNIFAINSRPTAPKSTPDSLSSRSKIHHRSPPDLSTLESKVESDIRLGWPSSTSASALLASLGILLSSVQSADRATPPPSASVETIRSVAFHIPNERELKEPQDSEIEQIEDRPTDISDVESLTESVDDPEGCPCAVLSFHASIQRLLLGLFAFILSDASTASSIDLDMMKKTLLDDPTSSSQIDAHTTNLRLLISRLRFGLQCCAQILAAPLLQPPLKSLQSIKDIEDSFDSILWPTGPLCSLFINPTILSDSVFITSYLDNFLFFCRGLLAFELTTIRPLQLPIDSIRLPKFFPLQLLGTDSLFMTSDMDDFPPWITVRFHEAAVLHDSLPISQSVLHILPGLSTSSIPLTLLSLGMSIGGIPITERWRRKNSELLDMLSESTRRSNLFSSIVRPTGMKDTANTLQSTETDETVEKSESEPFLDLMELLKVLPKYVIDSFNCSSFFIDSGQESVYFGGWELTWSSEIQLCEILGVSLTRLFGLPVSLPS